METISNIKTDECGDGKPSVYPYLCSAGKLSQLWGRNIQARPYTKREMDILASYLEAGMEPQEAFEEWADQLFLLELWDLELGLIRILTRPIWNAAPQEAKIITLNMAYNMGLSRFNADSWPNFFRCFRRGDWAGCAVEMQYTDATQTQTSKWYTDVDNHTDNFVGRSERLVTAMAALAEEEL